MGQKVNPLGIRLGITRDWTSRWYAGKKQFPINVFTDFRVRKFLKARLSEASVSRVLIERAAKKVNITIQTARPGIVIGKKGEDIEKLRQETAKLLGMSVSDVRLNIAEIRKPELDSQLVADSIAQQIEKRVMFRRAMKRAVMSTMRSGALGVTVQHHLRRHRRQGVDLQGRGIRQGSGRSSSGRRRRRCTGCSGFSAGRRRAGPCAGLTHVATQAHQVSQDVQRPQRRPGAAR
jgi:ribosomal protein S3